MSFHSFENPVVWSILVLGFICYQLLTYYIIRAYSGSYQLKDASWITAVEIFIGALPFTWFAGHD